MTKMELLRRRRSMPWTQLRSSQSAFDPDRLDGPLRVAILIGQAQSFGPYAVGLAHALGDVGVDVTLHAPNDALPASDAVVLVGLHRFEPNQVRALHRDRTVIAVQTEQLTTALQGAPRYGSIRFTKILSCLAYVDGVIDWSAENASVLRPHHPRVTVLPFGLIEADLHPRILGIEPTHDLAFIGHVDALAGRRGRILDELRAHFDVHPSVSGVWGAEKLRVFAEARIVLNLHVESSAVFESPRFFDVLGARRPLISEPVHNSWPFRSGHDFQEASVLNLKAVVRRMLDDHRLRNQFALAGRATAEQHGMTRVAAGLVRLLIVAHRP